MFYDMPLPVILKGTRPTDWVDSNWMAKIEDPTIVVFRWWRNGVIALFPEDKWDLGFGLCTSYEHIGQHGGAYFEGIMAESRPATPLEYASLYTELENIGYNLDVRPTYPIEEV